MKSPYDYVIKPVGDRYNNKVQVDPGKDLILNTEISNHQYINRVAEIVSVPILKATHLRVGQKVVVHHNIFRRWYDIKGRERNSRSFLAEDKYIAHEEQVYMYEDDGKWKCMPGFTFVKPFKSKDELTTDTEQQLKGVVVYSDGVHKIGSVVGFRPNMEFEFVLGGNRLYNIDNRFITIDYGHKTDEEEYNPRWAESSGRVN